MVQDVNQANQVLALTEEGYYRRYCRNCIITVLSSYVLWMEK